MTPPGPLEIDLETIRLRDPIRIPMGSARRPDGCELTVDGTSLRLNGKPWLPVMGEFHFSRYPEPEWREELLKMLAGGIDIVATYVFWIHHEEIEGEWDWAGRRNLRGFVELCNELELPIVVRMGPWCHGEVRNGGLPDWILPLHARLRTEDAEFLSRTRALYQQIASQIRGLLWEDGGPVIGAQLDNEYHGKASYLLALKQIAIEAGIDVPLYTRTGWPELTSKMPFGQILPLYGAYAEGFWDRELTAMPGKYWRAFTFAPERADAAVATDRFGQREASDADQTQQYPYLTCELGGGMMSSYHRRILIDPMDVYAIALVKIGSGSNLPGYYMYHGGANPPGRLSTLHESQETNYPNDLPVMSYDFQAPLGEYGQVRESYHMLRLLHLFLRDFGSDLALMKEVLPDEQPRHRDDSTPLRYAIRTDGERGFLFINNYQRGLAMPRRENVQFNLKIHQNTLKLPLDPVSISSGAAMVWPFNLDLGGARLVYATAQAICTMEADGVEYLFFMKIDGIPAEFVFDRTTAAIESTTGNAESREAVVRARDVPPGNGVAVALSTTTGRQVRVVLLDETTARMCWKVKLAGREHIALTRAGVTVDGDVMRLRSDVPRDFDFAIFPADPAIGGAMNGIFQQIPTRIAQSTPVPIAIEQLRQADPPRRVALGAGGVAAAPGDEDFRGAGVWRIKFPPNTPSDRDLLLRIRYVGDVARLELDGQLLTDNFYNGDIFEIGLKRHAPRVYQGELLLRILPLSENAPIHLPEEARPDFGTIGSALELIGVELVEYLAAELNVGR